MLPHTHTKNSCLRVKVNQIKFSLMMMEKVVLPTLDEICVCVCGKLWKWKK